MEHENKQTEQPTAAPASGMVNEACTCCPTDMCKNVCAAIADATGTNACENQYCQAICTKYAQLREYHPYAKTGCDYMEVFMMFFYTHVIVRVLAIAAPYKESHIVPATNYCAEKCHEFFAKATEAKQTGVEMYNNKMTTVCDLYNAQAAKAASMCTFAMETVDQKFPQAKTIYAEQAKPYVDMVCAKHCEVRAAATAYCFPAEKPKTE